MCAFKEAKGRRISLAVFSLVESNRRDDPSGLVEGKGGCSVFSGGVQAPRRPPSGLMLVWRGGGRKGGGQKSADPNGSAEAKGRRISLAVFSLEESKRRDDPFWIEVVQGEEAKGRRISLSVFSLEESKLRDVTPHLDKGGVETVGEKRGGQ
ncbi:hypothetical protein CDAR_459241 [Caerostris darwini]|uniref:Uncharacterized protein n=1 Tax=Caerostris darwini TaxID=1538125 RepID=A0AAV4PKA8_9ARAC|nr:hypothetical protein CDAR_459241 [Caerostris darwini]